MKPLAKRLIASLVLALLAALLLSAAASTGGIKNPDKLIILSTSDVKGKTSPCG